jgi:hypothetical protein
VWPARAGGDAGARQERRCAEQHSLRTRSGRASAYRGSPLRVVTRPGPTPERSPTDPDLPLCGSSAVPSASANRTLYAPDPGAGPGATRNCPDVVVRDPDLTELSSGSLIPLGRPGGREPSFRSVVLNPRGLGDGAQQSALVPSVTTRVKECPGSGRLQNPHAWTSALSCWCASPRPNRVQNRFTPRTQSPHTPERSEEPTAPRWGEGVPSWGGGGRDGSGSTQSSAMGVTLHGSSPASGSPRRGFELSVDRSLGLPPGVEGQAVAAPRWVNEQLCPVEKTVSS